MSPIDVIPIEQVEPKPPSWLWPGYLLRRAVNLIVGPKDVGKTQLLCWIAARASQGRFDDRPLRVFVDTKEDDVETVLRPRIEAAGADLAWIETRKPGRA